MPVDPPAPAGGQPGPDLPLLAAGLAHDVNNVLNVVLGYGELLRAGLPAGDQRVDYAQEILAACQRGIELTRQLAALGGRLMLAPRRCQLEALLTSLRPRLAGLLGPELVLHLQPGAAGPALADELRLGQVLDGLMHFLRRRLAGGGTVRAGVQQVEDQPALVIEDDGPAPNPQLAGRFCQPYAPMLPNGKGSLDLAAACAVLRQLGGRFQAQALPDRGLRLALILPAAPPPGTLVLVVEPDPVQRREVESLLCAAGHAVLTAGDAVEALPLLAALAAPCVLVGEPEVAEALARSGRAPAAVIAGDGEARRVLDRVRSVLG